MRTNPLVTEPVPASKRIEQAWFEAPKSAASPKQRVTLREELDGYHAPPMSRGPAFLAVAISLVAVAIGGTYYLFRTPSANPAIVTAPPPATPIPPTPPVGAVTLTNAEVVNPRPRDDIPPPPPATETAPAAPSAKTFAAPAKVAEPAKAPEPPTAREPVKAAEPVAQAPVLQRPTRTGFVAPPATPRRTSTPPATPARATPPATPEFPDLDRAAAAAGVTPSTPTETAPPATTTTAAPSPSPSSSPSPTEAPPPSDVMPDVQLKR